MMRYSAGRYQHDGTQLAALRPRNRFDGYQFSLLAPPATVARAAVAGEPYSVRSVTPSLRPLMARTNGRCPECAGPLVSGEACLVCPVCGFRRQGW